MTRSSVRLMRSARPRCVRALAIWLAITLSLAAGCVGEVYGGAERDEVERALAIVPACPATGARAYDLKVETIALYQSVKIPLYEAGRWLPRDALPIIAHKQALVRVFVRPEPHYQPRALRAVLRVRHGDHTVRLVDQRVLAAPSSDAELASTFNLEVAPALLTPDARVSVALEEADCALSPADEARAAAAVAEPLGAEPRGTLRVVLVPMRVGGRVPAVTASTVAHITEALHAYFPVPEVEVRVDDVHEGEPSVPPDGKAPAWRAMLDRVGAVRARRTPEHDVYYVGLFQPAASYEAFCTADCTLGLAHPASPTMVRFRYAVAAFFGDERGGETVAHELGHAHGLEHAPCAARSLEMKGEDPAYPEADGTLGAWGWDARTGALVPPSWHDLMSYCGPYGISPYHYAKLAARTRLVDRVERAP